MHMVKVKVRTLDKAHLTEKPTSEALSQEIPQFYLHTDAFIRQQNEPRLCLLS